MKKNLVRGLLSVSVLTGVLIFSSAVMAYEAGDVSNGGTIKGKVVFAGTSIPTRTVVPTKNKDVCGGLRKVPLVETGEDNAVKNAVAIIKDIKKGKPWGAMMEPAKIDNEKCVFQPHVQIVPIGSDFAIHNSDPFLHNTHSFHGNKTVFNVALPFPGAQVKRKLDQSGVIRVECDVHGWMQGWIYVAANPYYALTGADGAFAINDVPPGDYTLLIWQEHSGEMEKRISMPAGKTVDVGTIEIR